MASHAGYIARLAARLGPLAHARRLCQVGLRACTLSTEKPPLLPNPSQGALQGCMHSCCCLPTALLAAWQPWFIRGFVKHLAIMVHPAAVQAGVAARDSSDRPADAAVGLLWRPHLPASADRERGHPIRRHWRGGGWREGRLLLPAALLDRTCSYRPLWQCLAALTWPC